MKTEWIKYVIQPLKFFKPLRLFSDTQKYGNDKHKIWPTFFYFFYNSKTISRILLKLIPCSCNEILHFTQIFIFFLIPTVSYWACPTWYVSSVTPLSPTSKFFFICLYFFVYIVPKIIRKRSNEMEKVMWALHQSIHKELK
jgi:hypothetical protein